MEFHSIIIKLGKAEIKLNITEHKILYQLMKRPLGTGELVKKLDVKDDETILLNCRKLIAKGLIYDKKTKKKGKYTIVEDPKIPAFLMYRARNRSLKSKILNDIFSSKNNENIKSFDDFSKNIGIYISYVLLRATRPGGPPTVNWIKSSKDPRMQDIDLLRETWLDDMLDQEPFFEQILSLKGNTDYQEFVNKFESSFSDTDIYQKIVFHEGIAEVRKLQKQNRKRMNEPQTERSDEEIYGEDETGYLDASNRKNKKEIKSS